MLRLFVRRELMDVETAQGMLAWPHSGFHVHDGVWVAAEDREFAVRLARYCARNPVALSRLEYQSDNATLTYHSDKPTGLSRRQGEAPQIHVDGAGKELSARENQQAQANHREDQFHEDVGSQDRQRRQLFPAPSQTPCMSPTACVVGSMFATIRQPVGSDSIGKNSPERGIIG